MTLQRRLKRIMTRKNWRVADLAREISRPYMTVREWVINGRFPTDYRDIDRILRRFE